MLQKQNTNITIEIADTNTNIDPRKRNRLVQNKDLILFILAVLYQIYCLPKIPYITLKRTNQVLFLNDFMTGLVQDYQCTKIKG